MRKYISIVLLFNILFGALALQAQTTSRLLGTWESTEQEDGEIYHVVYQFKEVDQTIKAYTVSLKDDKGNAEAYSDLALDHITFKHNKGTGTYYFEYEGKQYDVSATLTLTDNNTLLLEYSYWGFSDSETWKRIKENGN